MQSKKLKNLLISQPEFTSKHELATQVVEFTNDIIREPANWAITTYTDQPLWVALSQDRLFYSGFLTPQYAHDFHVARAKKICPSLLGSPEEKIHILSTKRLLLKGTTFQQQVWQAIAKVPAGSLTTYKQLGLWMQPSSTSYRAIGNAVGANPISGYIPCHRIIQSNGDLGGYYWGTQLKQLLLRHEFKMS